MIKAWHALIRPCSIVSLILYHLSIATWLIQPIFNVQCHIWLLEPLDLWEKGRKICRQWYYFSREWCLPENNSYLISTILYAMHVSQEWKTHPFVSCMVFNCLG